MNHYQICWLHYINMFVVCQQWWTQCVCVCVCVCVCARIKYTLWAHCHNTDVNSCWWQWCIILSLYGFTYISLHMCVFVCILSHLKKHSNLHWCIYMHAHPHNQVCLQWTTYIYIPVRIFWVHFNYKFSIPMLHLCMMTHCIIFQHVQQVEPAGPPEQLL